MRESPATIKGSINPNCSCIAPKDVLGLSVYKTQTSQILPLQFVSKHSNNSVVKTTNFIIQCMHAKATFKYVKYSVGRGLNVFGVGLESDFRNIDSGQTIQTSLLNDYQRTHLNPIATPHENAIASEPDQNTTVCCVS